MAMEWKDITSYSRDDKERKPTGFGIEEGPLRISITCGHIYHRPNWVMHCRELGLDAHRLHAPAGIEGLEAAKEIALTVAKTKLEVLKLALAEIKAANPQPSNKEAE